MDGHIGLKRVSVFLAEATLVNSQAMEQALRRRLPKHQYSIQASALSSTEVSEFLRKSAPEVILLSENLADGPLTGFNVLRKHRDLWTTKRVVMLVQEPTQEAIIDSFRCGAKGVFLRSAPLSALSRCVRAVAAGQVWANSGQLQWLLQAFMACATPTRLLSATGEPILSLQEETIVGLVVQGLTNREIGAAINRSEHTVRNYIYQIYNKLGVSSRVELTLYSLAHRQTEQKKRSVAAG